MKNGMVIIDADGHAVDNEPVYRERLPEQYRKRSIIIPRDNFDRHQNGKITETAAIAGAEPRRQCPARGSICRSSIRPAG